MVWLLPTSVIILCSSAYLNKLVKEIQPRLHLSHEQHPNDLKVLYRRTGAVLFAAHWQAMRDSAGLSVVPLALCECSKDKLICVLPGVISSEL